MLDELADKVYDNAVAHGFYEDIWELQEIVKEHGTEKNIRFLRQIWLCHRLMLIVTELAEGVEAIRDNNFDFRPKTGGLGEELSDAQIRLADLWKHAITWESFDRAVDAKHEFNVGRPYLHNRSL